MLDIDTLIDSEDLFYTEFPEGWKFTWRLLSLKEYRRFHALRTTALLHRFFIYKKVFERCLIGNAKLISEDLPMFIPICLGELIMYLSGDCNSETIKDEITVARAEYGPGDLIEIMKRTVMMAFPTYDLDTLEALNRAQLIRKFIAAEQMLAAKFGKDYHQLNVEEITTSREQESTEEFKPIDFESDNREIKQNSSPWAEADALEYEYQQKQEAKKITPDQARKLDRVRRQRR